MDAHKELYAAVMEAEIRVKESRVYTALLMTLGLAIIIVVTGHLVIQEFYAQKEHTAFLIIGSLLFFSGWLWQMSNEKRLKSANEDYDDLGNIEEEGRRIHTYN